jgi:hypothetical protein
MAVATRVTRRLVRRRNPLGQEIHREIHRGIPGQPTTRLPSPVILAEQGTTIGRDKPHIKGIRAGPMRRRVRPKEMHRVVRTVVEQTEEETISVQAAPHQAARHRAGISMAGAMWIEDTDSKAGGGQTRERLPRVPLLEIQRPGLRRAARLQPDPRRTIRTVVRQHSLRTANSHNSKAAVHLAVQATRARIARRAIAVKQVWEHPSNHKAAVIEAELRRVRGNSK